MQTRWITVDGNEAAARVAYHLSDIIGYAHCTAHGIDTRWALYESLAKR